MGNTTNSHHDKGDPLDFLVKTTMGCSTIVILVLFPFTVINFLNDRIIMGLATASAAIAGLCNVWFGLRGRYSLIVNTYLATVTGAITVVYTLIEPGALGSYWPYLLCLSYYFVLPEKRAWFFNSLALLIIIPTAWAVLEHSSAVGFSAVLLGVCSFAFISMRKINSLDTRSKEPVAKDRLLLEAIPDPVVVYAPNREISYINEAFEATYGWTKKELIGGEIDFVPPEEAERTKEAWRRTLNGEKIFFETRRKKKDGQVLNIQLRTAILKDQNGKHSASIVLHRDVTRIKQAEIERERLIGKLQQALSDVKTLSGFLPICSSCKKIRDDKGYWNQIEAYLRDHSEAQFSHGMCPDCAKKLYPDLKMFKD